MINLTAYREIKVVEQLAVFLLWAIACTITLVFKGYYNQDLGVSVFVIQSLEGVKFLEALETNSVIFWLLRILGDSFVFNGDYLLLIYCFYIVVQSYIILCLVRYAGFYHTALVILIVFFTVILNQMRFGIAISLMLTTHFDENESPVKRGLMWVLIALFHIFVGGFYLLYLATRKFNYLIYVFAVVALIGYSSLTILLEDSRYLYYLEEDAARGSFSFLLYLAIYGVAFINLDYFHRLFFGLLLIIAGASYSLASVSSRLSELSIIFLLVILAQKEISTLAKLLLLFLSAGFFFYRAYNWFVLGLVPMAP
ncbi:hypothetical protein [Pedobacter insulae]|uniref:EpsG family protein n=1 Tax=Pedobacter insulae TaxID=414048 RepID=A0A1I2TBG4_9SPHI|nr:hypothetical protein [Pedobacter insulae]SFG62138.1 hypothetical protein SAMN04489864_101298 [Pedobacter insulae]